MLAAWMFLVGCDGTDDPKPSDSPADTSDTAVDTAWTDEICNGVDDDGDGRVDEGSGYVDADGDGRGAAAADACTTDAVVGFADDCDDTDPAVSPLADELCAGVGVDEDCDGRVDEDDAADCVEWWEDQDGDGVGAGDSTCSCAAAGAVVDGDCDDTDPGRVADCSAPEVVTLDTARAVVVGSTEALGLGNSLWTSSSLGGETPVGWVVLRADDAAGWVVPIPESGEEDAEATATATFASGYVVAVGDVDSDGVDDLVHAHPDCTYDSFEIPSCDWTLGVAAGPLSGSVSLDAALSLSGNSDNPPAVEVGGDVDGDALADALVIEAPSGDDNWTWRLSGGTLEPLLDSTDFYWASATGITDVDGDGVSDLAAEGMGSGYRHEGLYVFAGPVPNAPAYDVADLVWTGDVDTVRPGGDLDGDGYGELLLDSWVTVQVISGATGSLEEIGRVAAETNGSGALVTAAGEDVDGDSRDDLLLSDSKGDADLGAAYLVYGPLAGTLDAADADWRVQADELYTQLGMDVAWVPGETSLFAVSEPASDRAAEDGGAVWFLAP